jgi:hypothetical protein
MSCPCPESPADGQPAFHSLLQRARGPRFLSFAGTTNPPYYPPPSHQRSFFPWLCPPKITIMPLPKTLPREREELTRLGVPPTLDFHISDWTYVRDWERRMAIQRLLANSPIEHSKNGGVMSASGSYGQQRAQVMMELPNDRDRCGLVVFLGKEILAVAVLQSSNHSEGVPGYLGECACGTTAARLIHQNWIISSWHLISSTSATPGLLQLQSLLTSRSRRPWTDSFTRLCSIHWERRETQKVKTVCCEFTRSTTTSLPSTCPLPVFRPLALQWPLTTLPRAEPCLATAAP